MDNEFQFDKLLNTANNFQHPPIDPSSEVRLLRLEASWAVPTAVVYSFKTVPIVRLGDTKYTALSYLWGVARSHKDVRRVEVEGQPFYVRQNLDSFLHTTAARGELGLFYIDAICINQLDPNERKCQVQAMASIFSRADRVLAWLGHPEDGNILENIKALALQQDHEDNTGCPHHFTAAMAGSRNEDETREAAPDPQRGLLYLRNHPYWKRIWIVQEVLLASELTLWCGYHTFFPDLLASRTAATSVLNARFTESGRPVARTMAEKHTPAEAVLNYRVRRVIQNRHRDLGGVGEMGDLVKKLKKDRYVTRTYKSQRPDSYYDVIATFSQLGCTDPRDKLYGVLGILHDGHRVRVDYEEGIEFAFYQALKLGFQDSHLRREDVLYPEDPDVGTHDTYLGYYCFIRDAFGMKDDNVSIGLLRRVLKELRFQSRLHGATLQIQWENQFAWRNATVKLRPDLVELLRYAEYPEEGLRDRYARRFRRGKSSTWGGRQVGRIDGWWKMMGFGYGPPLISTPYRRISEVGYG